MILGLSLKHSDSQNASFAGAKAPVPVRHPGGEALASLYPKKIS